jgi:hypothetical protein
VATVLTALFTPGAPGIASGAGGLSIPGGHRIYTRVLRTLLGLLDWNRSVFL